MLTLFQPELADLHRLGQARPAWLQRRTSALRHGPPGSQEFFVVGGLCGRGQKDDQNQKTHWTPLTVLVRLIESSLLEERVSAQDRSSLSAPLMTRRQLNKPKAA